MEIKRPGETVKIAIQTDQMGICQKCHKRQATVVWTESEFAFIHGMNEEWCDICATTTQLEYAKKLAANIPTLEARLKRELQELRRTVDD